MKAIICYYELASQAINKETNKLNPLSFSVLKAETRPQLIKLEQMKY